VLKLVTVGIFSSRMEAEVVKGLLETRGIKSIIMADDAGGMRPFPIAYVQGVELKVMEEDLEKAKEIIGNK